MVRVTPVSSAYLNDWSGGINTESGYDTVKGGELPVVYDWQLSPYGELASRLGRQMVTASWAGVPWAAYPMNLYWYHCEGDGGDYVITGTLDGQVWRTDAGAGAPGTGMLNCLTGVATPVDMGTFTAASYPHGFAVLDDYAVLTAGGANTHWWKGGEDFWVEVADTTLDDSGTEAAWEFPQAVTVCSAFSRMWAGNVTVNGVEYPSRMCWSGAVGTLKEDTDPAGPWSWPSTNWVDINPEDGGHITKIVPFGQAVIVFKQQSTYALVGAGDPATARLYLIDNTVGCTSPGTVATGEGKLFWITSDGSYQYDGSQIIPVGVNNRTALRDHGVGQPAHTQAAYWWSGYWVSAPGALWFHDMVQDAWWRGTDGGAGLVGISDGMFTAPDGGGIAQLNAGVYPGYHQMFDDTQELVSVYTAPYFETGWMPPPSQRAGSQYRLRTIQMGLGRGSSTVNEGRIRVTMIVEGGPDPYDTETSYLYDLMHVYQPGRSEASNVMLRIPGSPHLCDRFRLRVELLEASPPSGAVTPVRVNSITVLFSERTPKRGSLNVGVPNV